MSPPSDAEVIGRSLGEPEAFGLVYDRHAATLLRFLGRRAGARVAEGLAGELFRVAFERRKTFDAARASALPWLYGIGANLLLKHRRGEAWRLRASARMAAGLEAADLARKLRREAAFDPAALDRGKAELMAAIRQEVQPLRRPTIVPRLPYEDVGAALSFLERAFGFREVPAARGVRADGAIDHTMVEFGDGMIGLGAQGAHGAFSPKRAGTASQYITVHVDDIDAHHQRALASGAEIVSRLHDHLRDYRVYEALDLEGHRWRFLQWLREAPSAK